MEDKNSFKKVFRIVVIAFYFLGAFFASLDALA